MTSASADVMSREEWLLLRRKGIGASDAPAVCGLSPWKTPLHVFLEKTGRLGDEVENAAMRWGTRLEEVVAQAYKEETMRPVYRPRQVLERHKTIPWLFCSLDRLTEVGGKGRILECKTARSADGWGEPGTDEVPAPYLVQVQHQMAVTGFGAADIAVLIGGQELRHYTVDRCQAVIDRLLHILGDFWGRIERGEAPEPDWRHAETPALIEQVQRVREGVRVELPEDSIRDVIGFTQHRKAESEARRMKLYFKARLVHAMGEAETAVLSSGHQVSRKAIHRDGYTVEATDYHLFNVKEPKTHE